MGSSMKACLLRRILYARLVICATPATRSRTSLICATVFDRIEMRTDNHQPRLWSILFSNLLVNKSYQSHRQLHISLELYHTRMLTVFAIAAKIVINIGPKNG